MWVYAYAQTYMYPLPPCKLQFVCVFWPCVLLPHKSIRAHLVGVWYEQISVTRYQSGGDRLQLYQHWDSIPRKWTSNSIIHQELLDGYVHYVMYRESCHPLKKEIPLINSRLKRKKKKTVFQKKLLFTSSRELGKDNFIDLAHKNTYQILIIDLACNHYFRHSIQLMDGLTLMPSWMKTMEVSQDENSPLRSDLNQFREAEPETWSVKLWLGKSSLSAGHIPAPQAPTLLVWR